jgi:hypothetical protein
VASGSAVSCAAGGSTSGIGAAISALARAMLALPGVVFLDTGDTRNGGLGVRLKE